MDSTLIPQGTTHGVSKSSIDCFSKDSSSDISNQVMVNVEKPAQTVVLL